MVKEEEKEDEKRGGGPGGWRRSPSQTENRGLGLRGVENDTTSVCFHTPRALMSV